MKLTLVALALAAVSAGCTTTQQPMQQHAGMDHSMMKDQSMKWDGAAARDGMAMCAMGGGAQAGGKPAAGGMCAMGATPGSPMGGMAVPQDGAKGAMQGCPMMAKAGQPGMSCCCGGMMKHGG